MQNENKALTAVAYDAEMRQIYPFYDEFHRQIMETVRVHNTEPLTWLDLSCGTGTLAARAFQSLPVSRMVCCEKDPELLDIARMRLPAEQTVLLRQELLLPELRERFDVITAMQTFQNLESPAREQAVRSCYDRLRKNGILFIFENTVPASQTGTDHALTLWAEYQKRSGVPDEQREAFFEAYRSSCCPLTVTAHQALLHRCGFEIAEVLWLSGMQAGFYAVRTER